MSDALAGKVAILTGASSGIGAAAARELARLECKVALAEANRNLDQAVTILRKRGLAQAAKRVGLEFVELHRATWDHRKLGGTY